MGDHQERGVIVVLKEIVYINIITDLIVVPIPIIMSQ